MNGRIWLIRHGETQWSRDGRHTGRTDIPLTEAGEQAAIDAGRRLREALDGRTPALVLSSPLERARRTAELAGLTPTDTAKDLLEWDYGGWEGLTTAEIRTRLGDADWTIWSNPIPKGETPGEQTSDVAARTRRVIERCLPLATVDADVILVAHGHVLRILTATWLGLDAKAGRLFALDPARLSVLGFEHEQHVIRQWNA